MAAKKPGRRKDTGQADTQKQSKQVERSRGWLRAGAGVGTAGSLTYFIVRKFDWAAWDRLIRKGCEALLQQNGPLPFLMLIVNVGMVVLVLVCMRWLVLAKDSEIRRVVHERDLLQGMLGTDHPSSGD